MDSTKLQFLKSLVEYPEETAEAEYKSALPFDSKSDFGAKLVKHILGQSNAGGGYLVIGFREDAQGKLIPDSALDENVTRSYETTRLCQSTDSFVTKGQRVQLQVHKIEFQGKTYPIISVRGFEESPLFCSKDFAGQDGKPILREGAIYIRDAAAKTVTVAGAEQFGVLLKLAVERRKAEIIQQVRALLDGSQQPVPSAANEEPQNDKDMKAWVEAESTTAVTKMRESMPGASAYIQVTHHLVIPSETWPQQELAASAQRAVCHNTGWPMGVVLSKPEVAPKPMKDGIRTIIHSTFLGEMFDYWTLGRDGRYFFLRTLAEESTDRGKNKIFFDTRIWDCAEALVHCDRLYRELGVLGDAEISISITHRGLAGRTLSVASRNRPMAWERKSEEDEVTWHKRVPLTAIETNLEALVGEATGELFTVFEYWHPDPSVLKSVLQEFLNSRV